MKIPLSPEQWSRLRELFDQAIALPSSARQFFVEDLRRSDAALAEELSSLLSSHDQATGFLESSLASNFWEAVANSKSIIFAKGDKIQNFEIERELGAGAFATVYLAKEISLNRAVALKVSANQGNEARTMAPLEHDHIVKVYSETVDPERSLRLVCMQYVPGTSLAGLLHKSPPGKPLNGAVFFEVLDSIIKLPSLFSPSALKDREAILRTDTSELVAWMGLRLSNALGYAHDKGVLHLDVKPANILLNNYGRPFLADFNVSLNYNEGPQTLLGGTLDYMSPEQKELFQNGKLKNSETLDARSDLYSLGVVLREWLCKTNPSEFINPRLTRILDRCTEQNPANRFSHAEELSQALSSYLEYDGVFKSLPKPGWVTAFALRRPLLGLTLGILIPQLIASVVNIFYNGIRVVGNLSLEQRELFKTLCLIWNPVIYAICVAILLWKMKPFYRFLAINHLPHPARSEMRRQVLLYPWWVTGVTACGWIIGSVIFPLCLHIFRGPVGPSIFIQFAISFVLSWLIAGAYSFLCSEFFCLRVLYPQLWEGENQIREKAQEELKGENAVVSRLYFLTGFIPLFAAILLVFIGPEDLTPSGYRFYRYFVTLLLAMGILGFRFSLQAAGQLTKTLSAFTGARNE